MKTAYIFAGGCRETDVAAKLLSEREKEDIIIAADAGMDYLDELNVLPDIFLGDMDSTGKDILKKYSSDNIDIRIHPTHKDETDMRLAIIYAAKEGAKHVIMFGATGGRLDHFMANIYILAEAYKKGISGYIINSQNRIRILGRGIHYFEKSNIYGKYISFISLGSATVSRIKGFEYDLDEKHEFTITDTLGISNEIKADNAFIEIDDGYLVMIEAEDKKND